MNIEIAEYSADLRLPGLAPDVLESVAQIARETLQNVSIRLSPDSLEFDYSGRDTGRRVVQFLCSIAPIIGDAGGEVECRVTTDTDKQYLEFYTIHHLRLYRQVGKVLKRRKMEVCPEPPSDLATASRTGGLATI